MAAFSFLTASEVLRIVAAWRTDAIFRHVAADAVGIMLLSSRMSLIWFAVIVASGVFVPNTWRRCALVVGSLGATPIVTSAICNVVFDRLDGGLMSMHLFNLTTWMFFACAVAIYGSHRIEVLRHEALEARVLRQYQLKQRLGAGGMGEVYLAEHVLLRRPCAIKLIRPDRAGDPNDPRPLRARGAGHGHADPPEHGRRSTTTAAPRTARSTTSWSTCRA